MEVFKGMGKYDHEQVLFTREPSVGYYGIIAIHDTTLGPALGGCRFWNYESEEEALYDVLRLSMGMTYKAAVAGLNLGGGKSVIIGDPSTPRREMVFRAHGRAVETLKGRYITAEDVGTSVEDMDYVHMETDYVVGIAGRSGDPSPVTAYGTYRGMKACAHEVWGNDSLKGKVVAVQGVGHVGYYLCENLAAEGAKLIVTDIHQDRINRTVDDFGAEAVKTDEIYGVDADIFAPCALGAIVNKKTIPQLKVKIIAGAANNQLEHEEDAKAVQEKGILYAPDYVINAGGLINVYSELADWTTDRSKRKAGEIYQTLLEVFEVAREEKMTTAAAADRIAERRISTVGVLHRSRIS
ncbi:MAG: Glu/Leu/Phe/Val dehydrogenase [Gemmatimonadota bacterium]|nr:MAG: Glu/Leu/Phe/Val dehydrogenase [Gemmatimonadota bacterium]